MTIDKVATVELEDRLFVQHGLVVVELAKIGVEILKLSPSWRVFSHLLAVVRQVHDASTRSPVQIEVGNVLGFTAEDRLVASHDSTQHSNLQR